MPALVQSVWFRTLTSDELRATIFTDINSVFSFNFESIQEKVTVDPSLDKQWTFSNRIPGNKKQENCYKNGFSALETDSSQIHGTGVDLGTKLQFAPICAVHSLGRSISLASTNACRLLEYARYTRLTIWMSAQPTLRQVQLAIRQVSRGSATDLRSKEWIPGVDKCGPLRAGRNNGQSG